MTMVTFKKIFPKFSLAYLRKMRSLLYGFFDTFKPYLNNMKYCGFDLYYGRGNGLIERIRFGSPDRIYERELCEKVVNELEKTEQKLFLDIGANIGLISLYVASKVLDAHIYAFEPGDNQSELFSITIFANQLGERIKLFRQGVSNISGRTNFVSHEDWASCGDGLINTGRGEKFKNIEIDVVTLDEWWAGIGKPMINVIKIDTEGAELFILDGGHYFIQHCQPVIFLEISLLNLKNYPYNHRDIYVWFEQNGYDLFSLSGGKCTLNNLDSLVASDDSFVAKPKK